MPRRTGASTPPHPATSDELSELPDVSARYQAALADLIEKVQADEYILAAFLVGSLSHDVVWSKSDIDLMLVSQEVKQMKHGQPGERGYTLVERDVNIHVFILTRSEFKRTMEGSLQSSFMHSLLNKGRLLYTHDEAIRSLYEQNRAHLGARDREVQLMRAGTMLMPTLVKAEKWLHVRRDVHYSFLWTMHALASLAKIEVLLAGEITGREVLQQAMRLNPQFFGAIYTGFIDETKTLKVVEARLDAINNYLRERVPLLFKPLFEYLEEANGIRTATEINHYFSNQYNEGFLAMACEWLADEAFLQKVAASRRLTEKSRVDVEEAAYYYEGRE